MKKWSIDFFKSHRYKEATSNVAVILEEKEIFSIIERLNHLEQIHSSMEASLIDLCRQLKQWEKDMLVNIHREVKHGVERGIYLSKTIDYPTNPWWKFWGK